MLRVEGVNVHYGSTQVLWDIDMEVGDRQIVSVMGPNGSGKSTVLKAIMGLRKASSGRVIFQGEDIVGKPAEARPALGIGLVLERRRLFADMTVRENVQLGGYARPKKEARDTEEWLMSEIPFLKERATSIAGKLSGGQQQLVAIARGAMSNPRLLLMDEPFLGLSPSVVESVLRLMRAINERGTAILFNEQNAKTSFGMSDRGYLLESGKVMLEGSGVEMLSHPVVRRVYLGSDATAEVGA